MAGNEGVVVTNLHELNTALIKSNSLVAKAMRKGLLEGAEPIRRDAGKFSNKLSGMERAKKKPPPWSIQKKGQKLDEVYIVPREKGKRHNRTDGDRRRATRFVELMYGKAYEPALRENEPRLREFVDNWIGSVTTAFSEGRV